MKKLAFLPFLILPFIPVGMVACQPAKVVTRAVIDVGLAICLAEHAAIQDIPVLRSICQWSDELAPYVMDLIAVQKKALAAAAKAGVCPPAPVPVCSCLPDGGK